MALLKNDFKDFLFKIRGFSYNIFLSFIFFNWFQKLSRAKVS